MGKNCVIVGCRNKDTNKMEGLKFHRIPKDEPRRSLWLKAINRLCPITGKPWVPSDDGRICSSHFVKEKSDNPSSVDYVPTLKLNSTPMAIPLPDRRKSQLALVTSRVEQVTSEGQAST
ncbi:hypothetical protein HELRODRAFT_184728 [Helobdella robusta]|uniref:THAP-type domain-containing protein n=1 Tax=Helobdella robusta TaxID=6412 RepID=T1FLV6_HELRO|nr:hypothetical protein HELRODRAFT_184728 [Helobdella robusta]ESO02969.1 hypothetical protein HELRODRAFT_184728 [Helobdella robusta]